jgi:starch-binding outer membrane protein, SusD/RagB family
MNTRTNDMSKRFRTALALLAAGLVGAGCNFDRYLDVTNPNAPTEGEVLTSIDGVIALAVGMQEQFASSMLIYVRAPALVTDEWGTRTAALAADQSLFLGNPDPTFGVVVGPYQATYRTIRSANSVIASAPQLGLGRGLEVGLIATARLFKAMALGMAIQQYERIPVDATLQGAPLQDRATVLADIIGLLEAARVDLASVTDAELATFRTRAQPTGFDLRNTVNAMLARYYLMNGQWQNAITAAERVNLNVISVFTYPDPQRNPIEQYAFGLNYVAALRSFVDEAQPGDQRPAYWVNTAAALLPANPPVPLQPLRQYSTRNEPFPVYLPGEMLLIRAEAHARLNQLPQARALINQVRTKCQPAPANQPAACLPALTDAQLPDLDAILRQVAIERRYELYMQGLRWEDLRRLGQYVGRAPKLAFLPLPLSECQLNPAAQC